MRVILTTLLILVSSYGFSSDNSTLKFSTEKVRAMWFMCATQFQRVAPTIPQIERVRLCDCYVDHMRTTFTPKQVILILLERLVKSTDNTLDDQILAEYKKHM